MGQETSKQKHILWIEDEEDQSGILENTFKDQGYHLVIIPRAEDALIYLQKTIPDLLLVDIKLPEMDGVEFFKQVKQSDELKNIPVIFITAFNSLAMAIEAKKQGAVDYITKPFDVDFLLDRIEQIFRGQF